MATQVNCFLNTSNGESKVYEVTLSAGSWNSTTLKYNCAIPELTCGIQGTVPPLIAPVGNQSEYSNITDAEATPQSGIMFTASKKPTQDIKLMIIDIK